MVRCYRHLCEKTYGFDRICDLVDLERFSSNGLMCVCLTGWIKLYVSKTMECVCANLSYLGIGVDGKILLLRYGIIVDTVNHVMLEGLLFMYLRAKNMGLETTKMI